MLLSVCLSISAIASASSLEPGLRHHWGLEGYYYRYNETVNNSFFMRAKGQLFGAYYAAEFQPENTSFRFSAEGRVAFGYKVHYKSNGTGERKDEKHTTLEARLLGSYYMPLENQWGLEGYTGIGIRYLITPPDNIPTTTGHYSYLRRSKYDYIPIGIRALKELCNGIKWIGYLEYDWFLKGKQTSYLNRNLTIRNRQSHGYGARTGIDFHIPSSTSNVTYTLGMFARYWDIKDSSINQGYYEPKNNTQEYGIRLGLLF